MMIDPLKTFSASLADVEYGQRQDLPDRRIDDAGHANQQERSQHLQAQQGDESGGVDPAHRGQYPP